MDLHLLWANDGRIFIKPMPRFLLDPGFWIQYLTCRPNCRCPAPSTSDINPQTTGSDHQITAGKYIAEGTGSRANEDQKSDPQTDCNQKQLRKCALGFLYSYACLISYEIDFAVAKEMHLLPSSPDDKVPRWEDWKKLVQEILRSHDRDKTHERFHHGELRLSRLNTINRLTQWPPFEPYFRSWRHYGDLFQANLTWLATATVFIALVLTAMQVGLATDQLKANDVFIAASYGFSVFAILGPLCAFGLVVLAALFNLLKDLPSLLGLTSKPSKKNLSKAPSPVEQV
jgi:hypothetical protein